MPDLFLGHTADGDEFHLPENYVTDTGAILAKRGTGKSNVGVVIAEEMHAAGHQWVAIDPGGDWWGIRSDGPGGPGLPVLILGGLHGDLPLLPTAGALVAELIVEQGISCVVDVSDFDTKADQVRFLTDFAYRLFDLQRRAPSPIHIVIEEAQEVLPQQVTADMTRCVSIFTKLVKIGRKHGIGVSLITQRSAALNNGALTQIDTLFVLRTPAAADKKAIRGWVEGATDSATWKEVEASLSRLSNGEAWAVSPHFLGFTGRVRFRLRHTFDSGATPELGQAREQPALASIDLGGIEKAMADVAEQAAADDPAALRKEISCLRAELAAAGGADPADLDAARARADAAEAGLAAAREALASVAETIETATEVLGLGASRIRAAADPHHHTPPPPVRTPPGAVMDGARAPGSPAAAAAPVPAPGVAGTAWDDLGKAERKVLEVLAQFPAGRTRTQIALLTGYSVKSSSLSNALGRLRSLGLVTKGTDPIRATPAGVGAAGDIPPAPTGPELLAHWRAQLGKAEVAVLDAIADHHPHELTRDEIADATDYSAKSSSLSNALGRLRSLELIHGFRLSEDLV